MNENKSTLDEIFNQISSLSYIMNKSNMYYHEETHNIEIKKLENNLYIIKNLSISLDRDMLLWILNKDCRIEGINNKEISIEFRNIDDSVEFYLIYKGYTRDE